MSFFVSATHAPKPKTKNIISISLLTSGIIAFMAAAQLFAFEDFPALLTALQLPGGEVTANFLAAFLVIVEVLALPFLLSMRLSPLFRVVSMVAGWITAGLWLKLSLWENLIATSASQSSIFGAVISVPVGGWSTFMALSLAVLVGWASWGMWPLPLSKLKN